MPPEAHEFEDFNAGPVRLADRLPHRSQFVVPWSQKDVDTECC